MKSLDSHTSYYIATNIAEKLTSIVAFAAMLFVTLSQVSTVGFCESSTEVFLGQHNTTACENQCSHNTDEHLSSECNNEPTPCEDSHVEFDIEIEDFVPASRENGTSSSEDVLPTSYISFSAPKYLLPVKKQIRSRDFARPPPLLPVSIRFGVMRL